MRRLLPLAALLVASPALADSALTIPTTPIDPNPSPSIWNGLYVGSGVTAAFGKGQKGQAGGDVFAGYDKKFDNNFVLGVKFDTGFEPFLTPSGKFKGFDFAMGSVKLGYELGRVTPYVYAGGGFARATNYGSDFGNAGATMNGLFAQGPSYGVSTFGAGFDYHVTNNVTIGASVGVVRGPGNAAF